MHFLWKYILILMYVSGSLYPYCSVYILLDIKIRPNAAGNTFPAFWCNCPRLIMRSTNYCLLSGLITTRCLTLSRLPLLSPLLPPLHSPAPFSPLVPPYPTYNYNYYYLATTMYHTEVVESDTINFWAGIVTSVPLVRYEQLNKNND